MAIDFKKYTNNPEAIEFLEVIQDYFADGIWLSFKCGDYRFHVDPGYDGAIVSVNGEEIASFDTIEDFFLKFMIDGKPFIERIEEIDYDF